MIFSSFLPRGDRRTFHFSFVCTAASAAFAQPNAPTPATVPALEDYAQTYERLYGSPYPYVLMTWGETFVFQQPEPFLFNK